MRTLAVAVLPLAVAASPAASQVGPILWQPISARSAAMGETGVADASDPANVFFNPANAVGPGRAYLRGTRWNITPFDLDELWIGGASVGVSLPRPDSRVTAWSVDFSYGRFDYGEGIFTDPTGMPLGNVDTVEEYMALTAAMGVRVGRILEVRFGAAAKRWSPDYPPDEIALPNAGDRVAGWAFDVGTTIAWHTEPAGWDVTPALALALVNAGPDVELSSGNDAPLPTRFHFGASVRVDGPPVRLLAADVPVIAVVYNLEAVERFHGGVFSWGVGGEFSVAEVAFVRAGVSDLDDDAEGFLPPPEKLVSGWGAGLGLPVGPLRARFDYAKTSNRHEEAKYGLAIEWKL